MKHPDLEALVDKTYRYLSDKDRLKAIGVISATTSGIYGLRSQLPKATEFFRDKISFLNDEIWSLGLDTFSNTVAAPLGFVFSGYVNNADINKKELALQVAFAVGWGALRHYVYEGLSYFDDINLADASTKTGLYTAYYAAYGAIYATFSDFAHRVSHGETARQAARALKHLDVRKRIKDITIDGKIQFNLALNIANMFNPWVEGRPTIASGLLVDYNMSLLRHSHKRINDAWSYVKKTFLDYSKNNRNETIA